jgi:hypothetical protein
MSSSAEGQDCFPPPVSSAVPYSGLNDLVPGDSSKSGDVSFTIPADTWDAILRIKIFTGRQDGSGRNVTALKSSGLPTPVVNATGSLERRIPEASNNHPALSNTGPRFRVYWLLQAITDARPTAEKPCWHGSASARPAGNMGVPVEGT